MQNGTIEPLLDKAKKMEKKYEWLQAAEIYKQATNLLLKDKEFNESAKLHEKTGFCYFKAAFQANTNANFKKTLELAIHEYEAIIELFRNRTAEVNTIQVKNSMAIVAYINSWIEFEPAKKKAFLDEWWNYKSEILKSYKKLGDQFAFAKTCNDILEGSIDFHYWIGKNREDLQKIRNQLISLGEKAIEILSKNVDEYELARAYTRTSLYCLISNTSALLIDVEEEIQKGMEYSKKALELSKRTGNAWLIGWSYTSAFMAADKENDYDSGLEFLNKQIEQGKITKDNYLLGLARFMHSMYSSISTLLKENPDKLRETLETNLQIAQKVVHHFQIINLRTWNAYYPNMIAYRSLASIELDPKKKYDLLKEAVENGRKALRLVEGWRHSAIPVIFSNQSDALYEFSKIEKSPIEKEKIIEELLDLSRKFSKIVQAYPDPYGNPQKWIALAKADLSKLNKETKNRISLLEESIASIETYLKLLQQFLENPIQNWAISRNGNDCYSFGEIFYELYLLDNEKTSLYRAIELYKIAVDLFSKADIITRVAESYWQKAKIQNALGEHIEAAKDYNLASKAYRKAAEKLPQLNEFYNNYSQYMDAWNRIEQAQYKHSIEDYSEAMKYYEEAASLHEKSKLWSYLAPNYYAWEQLEKGEDLSRKEEAEKAIEGFSLANEYFNKAEEAIKTKLSSFQFSEEREMATRLLKASDLRRTYCQARICIEEAKIFDIQGEYQSSSKSFGKAATSLAKIVEELDSEEERRELRLIMVLSQAWEKMALAKGQASPDIFWEAANLFEEAKNLSLTEKTSLWALGNSSFCKGLAAKIKFQNTFEKTYHSMANKHLKQAANYYTKAGFEPASEYAKATQRLFEAYVYMNSAEEEIDPEKKTKYYQFAEKLLEVAAGLFVKAKHLERTSEVQELLVSVRDERALASSLAGIMQTPSIASSTLSFAAPTPTREASVGVEKFEHANVQANLVAGLKEVRVGEAFSLSVEFVNAGKEPALLTGVEDFVPPDFIVVKKPEIYRLEDTCLNMKGKQIAPLKLVEAKVVLQPSKKGIYQLKPTVHYLDELGQNKSLQLKSVEIKVEEVILADRVSTGTKELDSLLLGGIPEGYAVVLTGSPSDERELLIKNFLEAGISEGQTSFYVATEADELENLLEKSGFYLFLCNPKPKLEVPDLPNVTRLRSKTDLTNLNIALLKAYRSVEQSSSKRVCIGTVSDVLVDHGVKTTRKWIAELTTDLVSKGFTVLAVLNPGMHPPDQATGVIDLFDGEISLYQTEDAIECKKSLQVKKLRNQDYIKNPICLTKSVA